MPEKRKIWTVKIGECDPTDLPEGGAVGCLVQLKQLALMYHDRKDRLEWFKRSIKNLDFID